MAHRDEAIGLLEPGLFYLENLPVGAIAASIVFEGVDVKDEGFSADPSGAKGGGDGHPIVGMNDIEGSAARNGAGGLSVSGHFGDQIVAVDDRGFSKSASSGKRELPVTVLAEVGIQQRGDWANGKPATGYRFPLSQISGVNGHRVGGDQIQKGGGDRFGLGQDEGDPMAETGQPLGYAEAGCAQAPAYPWRELPPEHENVHGLQPPFS
jgi:hypothetical protein